MNIKQSFSKAIYKYYYRPKQLKRIFNDTDTIKINFGCGRSTQSDYINIDIRKLENIDIVADLNWCEKVFNAVCDEIYLSHVLEHFKSPGKNFKCVHGNVLWVLFKLSNMLKKYGKIRIAVPDFQAIAQVYLNKGLSLSPKILGRISGEQNYPENTHYCIFDENYLTDCLHHCGFVDVKTWDPEKILSNKDSSFDMIEEVKTSLNLIATKA